MNESTRLTIEKRDTGASKGAKKKLRREGFVPGSISKKGGEAFSFSVRKDELAKALNANGMSSVYTLSDDQKNEFAVMVREVQQAPLTREWLHVNFQEISLTEETTAEISINLIGRDELQHRGLEVLQQLDSVQLQGLPGDFPPSIEIDVSKMEAADQVSVADLELPEGITAVTESDRQVLSVSYPRLAEEEESTDEETADDEAAAAAEESTEE